MILVEKGARVRGRTKLKWRVIVVKDIIALILSVVIANMAKWRIRIHVANLIFTGNKA